MITSHAIFDVFRTKKYHNGAKTAKMMLHADSYVKSA